MLTLLMSHLLAFFMKGSCSPFTALVSWRKCTYYVGKDEQAPDKADVNLCTCMSQVTCMFGAFMKFAVVTQNTASAHSTELPTWNAF